MVSFTYQYPQMEANDNVRTMRPVFTGFATLVRWEVERWVPNDSA